MFLETAFLIFVAITINANPAYDPGNRMQDATNYHNPNGVLCGTDPVKFPDINISNCTSQVVHFFVDCVPNDFTTRFYLTIEPGETIRTAECQDYNSDSVVATFDADLSPTIIYRSYFLKKGTANLFQYQNPSWIDLYINRSAQVIPPSTPVVPPTSTPTSTPTATATATPTIPTPTLTLTPPTPLLASPSPVPPSPSAQASSGEIKVIIPLGASRLGYKAFGPEPLVVKPGTLVTWINQDTVPHSITSEFRIFDSGIIVPGQQYSYRFNQAGTFHYFCTLHGLQSKSGSIQVNP